MQHKVYFEYKMFDNINFPFGIFNGKSNFPTNVRTIKAPLFGILINANISCQNNLKDLLKSFICQSLFMTQSTMHFQLPFERLLIALKIYIFATLNSTSKLVIKQLNQHNTTYLWFH